MSPCFSGRHVATQSGLSALSEHRSSVPFSHKLKRRRRCMFVISEEEKRREEKVRRKMANTKVLLLVLSLSVSVGVCLCKSEDAVSMTKTTSKEAKDDFSETMAKSESKAEGKLAKNKAEGTASKSTERTNSAASASQHASHKSSKVKAKRAMGYAKTAEAYNEVDETEAKHKPADFSFLLSRNSEDDKELEENVLHRQPKKVKVADTYKPAKETKFADTYKAAKETVTEGAKATYENAKEKASQATGDLGAKVKKSNR